MADDKWKAPHPMEWMFTPSYRADIEERHHHTCMKILGQIAEEIAAARFKLGSHIDPWPSLKAADKLFYIHHRYLLAYVPADHDKLRGALDALCKQATKKALR